MMISPNEYLRQIKWNGPEEIASAIRGLKNDIGRIKNILEHPSYWEHPILMCPSYETQISVMRDYLSLAIDTYYSRLKDLPYPIGYKPLREYKPSRADEKASIFQGNINSIDRIVFSYGCYASGYDVRTITFNGDDVIIKKENTPLGETGTRPLGVTKEAFLTSLVCLHIGEWRRTYSQKRFGYPEAVDGIEWSIEFHYTNGSKPFKSGGLHSFPYNFNELVKLMAYEER